MVSSERPCTSPLSRSGICPPPSAGPQTPARVPKSPGCGPVGAASVATVSVVTVSVGAASVATVSVGVAVAGAAFDGSGAALAARSANHRERQCHTHHSTPPHRTNPQVAGAHRRGPAPSADHPGRAGRRDSATFAGMAVETELQYDPYDYDIDERAQAVWKRLRDEAPLFRNDEFDFWAVSRYDDVLAGLLDVDTFRSGHGTVLEMMSADPFPMPMFIFRDPPDHTLMRKLVSRAFTPRAIGGLEHRIEAICAKLLDPFDGASSFDYVDEFGALLPPTVILALLGFPTAWKRSCATPWMPVCTSRRARPRGARPRSVAASRSSTTPATSAMPSTPSSPRSASNAAPTPKTTS